MISSGTQFFRAGVGAMIIDEDGLILFCKRSDFEDAWQNAAGRIRN